MLYFVCELKELHFGVLGSGLAHETYRASIVVHVLVELTLILIINSHDVARIIISTQKWSMTPCMGD